MERTRERDPSDHLESDCDLTGLLAPKKVEEAFRELADVGITDLEGMRPATRQIPTPATTHINIFPAYGIRPYGIWTN